MAAMLVLATSISSKRDNCIFSLTFYSFYYKNVTFLKFHAMFMNLKRHFLTLQSCSMSWNQQNTLKDWKYTEPVGYMSSCKYQQIYCSFHLFFKLFFYLRDGGSVGLGDVQ